MRMLQRLVAVSTLAWVVGCDGSGATSPTSSTQPVTYTVSGTVSETVDGISGPLANRSVRIWVEPDLRTDNLLTNPSGRYTTRMSPGARVFLWGSVSSFDEQPCIASAVVNTDTTVDVEVFPLGTSKPPSGAGPLITGVVFETTPEGRRPLRANVQLDRSEDNYVAWTRTDSQGRFFLCRVNTRVRMNVAALDLSDSFSEWIPGTGDLHFEIEFKR